MKSMRLFCCSLLLILFFGCSNTGKKHNNLIEFIPDNASLIIKTNNLESLNSSLKNNDFIERFSKTTAYNRLQEKLKPLALLKPLNEVVLCLSEGVNDNLDFTVITKLNSNILETDSLPNYTEETLTYKNKTIIKSTLNDNSFYTASIDSVLVVSSSKSIVENTFSSFNDDDEFKKAYRTTSNDKSCSIILKPNSEFISTFFIEDFLTLNNFTEYLALDIEMNQNSIYFNGITKALDSSKKLINIFKNTYPQVNQTQHITPSNSDGFMSFSFNDFKMLESNLLKYQQKDSSMSNAILFNDVVEVGVIYEDNNRAIVLNSVDVIATKDALIAEQSVTDTYREIEIYNFSQPKLFAETFSPLISDTHANLYCILDNFFVFSSQMDMLQNIIASYQNKTTFSNSLIFEDTKEKLSDASSILQINNASTLKNIFHKNLGSDEKFKIVEYNQSAIQFIYDNNFAHVNGVVNKNKTRGSLNSVSEELNIKLDNDILNTPQFVTNHITKHKEIVVQDVNNNLYLISNKGKILWKKRLQGPVLGRIEQIDIYKNGRLQLAFATPKKVYVLDRKGREVKPFSLNFKDKITQPLAIFDYDKRKDYRLLVTQGKNVLMYNVKGKIVSGFKFKSAKNAVVCKPEHFRIGSKDYIIIKTNKNLYILDRLGKIRVKPKQSFSYSNQPVFLYNNTFTTTSESGDLVSVNPLGNVSSRNLNLSNNHFIETTSKTLVTQSENKLFIKNKTTELDFGNYVNPKIFYINDKIYVSTTDLQSHKIYLFDSASKLLPNFPVYGNSTIELDNIDKDKNLEFVTIGESNAIILYQIN